MPEAYSHRRLSGASCIRVLELAPAVRKNSVLKGTLIEVDLWLEPHSRPAYEALSYAWGSQSGDQQILCEGKELLVTENCQAALQHFRHEFKKRLIWIDAICIDQTFIPERNHQVEMMREIYREANHVRIWLGSPDVDRSFTGFRLSLKTTEMFFKVFPTPWFSETYKLCAKTVLRSLLLPYLLFWKPSNAHGRLSESAWFERIWTIQEVSFARAATVHYGSLSCDWECLSDILVGNDDDTFEIDNETIRNLISLRISTRGIANDLKLRGYRGGIYRDYRGRLELDVVFNSLHDVKASDPRDKIFGIYGILLLLGVKVPPPDYEKSLAEVYTETMSAIFTLTHSLRFWHVFNPLENTHQLPSWVLDWTASGILNFKRSSSGMVFNADRVSLPFNIGKPQSSKLQMEAKIIDYVDTVGLPFPVANISLSDPQAFAALQSWRDISKQIENKLGNEDLADRETYTLRILVNAIFRFETRFNPTRNVDLPHIERWLSDENRTYDITGFFHGDDALYDTTFERDVRPYWKGQKVFKSRFNRLGMTSAPTTINDVVILSSGSDVPLIVRPCGEYFTYIGPIYLPGAMFGEMWPRTDMEKESQLQCITII